MGRLRRSTEDETAVETAGFEAPCYFLTFLWWRSPRHEREPKHRCARHSRAGRCNFSGQLRVVILAQQRILVVGSDNNDVGNQTAPRKAGQQAAVASVVVAPGTEKAIPPKRERVRICGAMSQQRGDSGHESAPQEFVQLVGYRDPKARPDPWVRPSWPAAIKR